MWERVFEMTVGVPAEDLWCVAANLSAWPGWDAGVLAVQPEADARVGGSFLVRAPGGRQVRCRVVECSAPHRLVYACWLPLARLRTRFEFDRADLHEGTQLAGPACFTRVRLSVQLAGPLAFFWRRILPEMRAGWLSDLAGRLVRRARAVSDTASNLTSLRGRS